MPELLEQLVHRLIELPPGLVYTIIGVLASVENVFPPVPADTAVALGAFLSTAGTVSAWSIFGVTWAANVASGVGVYIAARTLGRRFFTGRLGSRLLNPRHLAKLEHLYSRHGTWGIFASRFVPGARALIPPFAGIAGLTWVKALVPMAVASAIWYGALTFMAATLVPKLDDLAVFVVGLNWIGLAFGALVVALVIWVAIARRRMSRGADSESSL
ncbi:MAG: DedA family protein [Gemmatimonadota bacterium]|nr:MAG: DedA family protein [Gemmatimonadota bacterium]